MKPTAACDLMSEKVYSVRPDDPAAKVIGLFRDNPISAVPVVEETGKPVGIITKKDVLVYAHAWGAEVITETQAARAPGPDGCETGRCDARAADLMNPVLVTASRSATAGELARLMRENNIHHILITHSGELAGIVSSMDLLRLLAAGQRGSLFE